MEYRKKIDLNPNSEYWFVEMGELDRLNGPSSYPFPTEQAARRFAVNHKRLSYGQRDVQIRFPDGQIEVIDDDV
jgi:hypothetical protein